MAKYGVENFIFQVIACSQTQEDCDELEKLLIIQYDSRNKERGYNITRGGEHADRSDEGLKAFIEQTSGDAHWTRQPEHAATVAEANRKRLEGIANGTWERNIVPGMLGKTHTQETKDKQATAKQGKLNHRYGTKAPNRIEFTDEQIASIRNDTRGLARIGKDYRVSKNVIRRIRNNNK